MPPPYGGVPKLSLLVAKAWKKMGHQVGITFVYRPEKADDLGAEAEYFFEYGSRPTKVSKLVFLARYFFTNPWLYTKLLMSYRRLDPRWSAETVLYCAYGVYMSGVLKQCKPDIILAEAALIQTFMVGQLAQWQRIPVVFDTYAEIHDMTRGINKVFTDAERINYWTRFLALADLVIAPGPHCCRGPLTYMPKEKVEFVYDGSDYSLCEINVGGDKQALRQQLKLPATDFLIGNVGAFEARKGQDHLIKAIAQLSKQGHPVGAVICGGSGDPSKWKALAAAEGVADKIHFFGRLSELDLARVLRSLDAFSDLENSPRACGLTMAILEGMAMSLPVVIYDNPEMAEVVKPDQNGFVVPIDNIDLLAHSILKMYQLPAGQRQSMGSSAAAAARKIDIEFTATNKLVLFEKLINSYTHV